MAHDPCDCDSTKRWLEKESAESENTAWLMANTKACTKCARPIEKTKDAIT